MDISQQNVMVVCKKLSNAITNSVITPLISPWWLIILITLLVEVCPQERSLYIIVLGTLLQSVCNANYPPRNSILNPILEDIYTHHGVLSRGYTCLNSIVFAVFECKRPRLRHYQATPPLLWSAPVIQPNDTLTTTCISSMSVNILRYLPQPLQMYKSILFDNRLTVTLLPNNKQYEHPHKRDIKGWEPLHLNLHTTQFYCRCLKENVCVFWWTVEACVGTKSNPNQFPQTL